MALMGGTITVDSAPGRGSIFTATLPLEHAAAVAPGTGRRRLRRTVPARAAPSCARPSRILLVEDNPLGQRVGQLLLAQQGHEVDVVADGAAAVAAVAAGRYGLVLMDCHLPTLDGFEATRRIRALAGDVARTPILACTASAMPADRARCLAAGMDGVVTKPLTPAALARALAGVVRPAAREVLDGEVIGALRGLGRDAQGPILDRMVQLYLDQAPRHLASLSNPAPAEVGRAAHALRGMSANVGAVAQAGPRLEAAASATGFGAASAAAVEAVNLAYREAATALVALIAPR
jgi:CheY-like chemotaxis protein